MLVILLVSSYIFRYELSSFGIDFNRFLLVFLYPLNVMNICMMCDPKKSIAIYKKIVNNYLLSGVILSLDLNNLIFFVLDIDECQTSFPCDQNCNNTIGSYICSCEDGFLKQGDRCIGEFRLKGGHSISFYQR